MSWDYRFISPQDADAVAANPEYYLAKTSLGSFRAIYDWLTLRAKRWHPRGLCELVVDIGPEGYVVLHLATAREHAIYAAARQSCEPYSDQYSETVRRHMSSYVPEDRDAVVEIGLQGRGSGDLELIAQWAVWMNATVFDHQSSELLPAQKWLE